MSHHYIQFSDVCFSYPGGGKALDGVSFRITHGERVALLGDNGAGKSTLLELCDALRLPSAGVVNIGDVPSNRRTAPLIRQTVGIVFQNPDDQLFMPTVEADVAFGPRNMRLPEQEVERRVVESLTMVGALALRKRQPGTLSGGQKRAVAIATVLAMEPPILLLDEPSANLDATTRSQLIDILDGFHHTILLATHDLQLARRICSRAITLSHGKVVSDGPIPPDHECPCIGQLTPACPANH